MVDGDAVVVVVGGWWGNISSEGRRRFHRAVSLAPLGAPLGAARASTPSAAVGRSESFILKSR